MISSEVKNRSQHSLKNRFFHLMAINLGITNKACLKKKNFSNEILKIIEKYRQILKKDLTKDKIKQEVKEASKEESQNLTENYNNSSKINFEIIEPKSKIENSNIQESFTMKGQESQTNINNLINMNNNYMNPIISNNFNVNFLNTIPFWNPLINQNFPSMYNIGNGFNGSNNFNGFNGFGLNGFLDPKMMLMTNPYLQNNFFLNYKKY